MVSKALLWGIFGVMAVCAVVLGIYGVRNARQANIVVEWSTASELDTAGFNLYRSENADGNFVRVNDEMIPASPDPWVGGDYSYLDEHVEAEVTYYYLLEDVDVTGNTNRHGPIEIRAKAGGRVELIFAAVFALVAGTGALGLILPRRAGAAPKPLAESLQDE